MKKEKNTNKTPWAQYDTFVGVNARWRDLDGYNHVTNSVYFNYFEEGRIALFNSIKAFKEGFSNRGKWAWLGTTLIRTAAEYRMQAFLAQQMIVAVRITDIRRCFIDTEYVIFDKKTGRSMATGTATNAVIDKRSFKPVTIPEELLIDIQQKSRLLSSSVKRKPPRLG